MTEPLIQEVTPSDASNDIDMDGLKIEDTQESLLKFTSKDNEFMLNLPRKECKCQSKNTPHEW
jgi:hypothetical protein